MIPAFPEWNAAKSRNCSSADDENVCLASSCYRKICERLAETKLKLTNCCDMFYFLICKNWMEEDSEPWVLKYSLECFLWFWSYKREMLNFTWNILALIAKHLANHVNLSFILFLAGTFNKRLLNCTRKRGFSSFEFPFHCLGSSKFLNCRQRCMWRWHAPKQSHHQFTSRFVANAFSTIFLPDFLALPPSTRKISRFICPARLQAAIKT